MIRIKRVYDAAEKSDGARFLVDRLWPRGVKKDALKLKDWLKDVSPSDELRKWFGHEPAKWNEFQKRYVSELKDKAEIWKPLLQAARQGDITLLFGARDTAHNNAAALKKFLQDRLR